MCAAVAVMPAVVTLPLTDLSPLTVIVPLPVAAVVTGGTSCAPVNITFPPPLSMPAQPASIKAAAATPVNDARLIFIHGFIFSLLKYENRASAQCESHPQSLANTLRQQGAG
jgi:hypothetical protein